MTERVFTAVIRGTVYLGASLHHHLSALLKIYIWIRSGERLKFGSGSQKSNLEGKVL